MTTCRDQHKTVPNRVVKAQAPQLATLPSSSLWLLAIGGILYTLGTLFHVSRTSWRISRRCADILVIELARLFIHGQRLSCSVSTSAFDARGVLLTCCELDFGSC